MDSKQTFADSIRNIRDAVEKVLGGPPEVFHVVPDRKQEFMDSLVYWCVTILIMFGTMFLCVLFVSLAYTAFKMAFGV